MAQQREQHKDLEQHRRETQKTLIREQVIHTLGEPAGLHKVQVQCRSERQLVKQERPCWFFMVALLKEGRPGHQANRC